MTSGMLSRLAFAVPRITRHNNLYNSLQKQFGTRSFRQLIIKDIVTHPLGE